MNTATATAAATITGPTPGPVPPSPLHAADRFDWCQMIRRARVLPSVKLVARALADYANRDGTSIHPGVQRLADDTCLCEKTVRTALKKLAGSGLIECLFDGSKAGRRGRASEWRLTFPADITTRVPMLDPDHRARLTPITTPVPLTGVRAAAGLTQDPGTPVNGTAATATPTILKASGTPVNDAGTPVTSSRTPVNGSRNTGNRYRPPIHRPHQTPNQGPLSVLSSPAEVEAHAHTREEHPANPLHSPALPPAPGLHPPVDTASFVAARDRLTALPDLGAAAMAAAEAELAAMIASHPGAPYRELQVVIADRIHTDRANTAHRKNKKQRRRARAVV